MKKLALPLIMLSGFTQAQDISFNEVSISYLKGDQDPAAHPTVPAGAGSFAADVSPRQQQLEGGVVKLKAEVSELFYVVAGYSDSKMDYSYQGYESEWTFQDASLGFGVHTPLTQDVPDTAVFIEARVNQLSYEFEDNTGVKADDEKTGQTLSLGLVMAPFSQLEVRPVLSRLSGVDEMSSTEFELGFLVRPIESVGVTLNLAEKVDLDQRRYEVGVVYKF